MNRLYVVEPALTITGAMADHRLRMQGGDVGSFLAAVISVLASRGIAALAPLASLTPRPAVLGSEVPGRRRQRSRAQPRRQPGHRRAPSAGRRARAGRGAQSRARQRRQHRRVRRAADDRCERRRRAARRARPRTSPRARSTRWSSRRRTPSTARPSTSSSRKLLERVPNSIYHALYEDETAAACKTIIPAAHPLESWGDLRATDGTVSIVQPLIAPLWGGYPGGRRAGRVHRRRRRRRARAAARSSGRRRARRPATSRATGSAGWRTASFPARPRRSRPAWPSTAPRSRRRSAAAMRAAKQGMEIAFVGDPKVYDGRFAQQRVAAGAAAPDHEADLGKRRDDLGGDGQGAGPRGRRRRRGHATATGTSTRRSASCPGHADDAVTLPLGYGRTGAEKVARRRRLQRRRAARQRRALVRPRRDAREDRPQGRVRDHAGPLDDGARRPRDAAARRRGVARRGAEPAVEVPRGDRGRRPNPEHPQPDHPQAGRLQHPGVQVGDGDRPQQVHRLQRLRRRLPVGEQHHHRRQGERPQGPRDAVDPHRPLLHGRRSTSPR